MQVSKWGNSLAVRIPASVAKALQLKAGDNIEIIATNNDELTLRKTQNTTEDLIERMKAFRGLAPRDFHFDREDANAR